MAFAAATHSRDLTDEQWDGRFLPEPVRRADGRGRPWRENRAVLNGILWILRAEHRRPTCRTAIRRIKPAIGGFSSGSASACCGASSKSSLRHCTPRLSGSAGSVHRWELRASQAGRRSRRQDDRTKVRSTAVVEGRRLDAERAQIHVALAAMMNLVVDDVQNQVVRRPWILSERRRGFVKPLCGD
jgi:hypothetical protein